MSMMNIIIINVLVLFIASLPSVDLFAGEGNEAIQVGQEGTVVIRFNDNIVNADINNANLSDVLNEIEVKTGIKINIDDKSILERKVTVSLKDSDVESLVKAVLRDNFIYISTKSTTGDNYNVKEVDVAGKSNKSLRRVTTRELVYGSGKDNVGVVRAGEGANIGPGSFAVDAKGNIYICDTVNGRVQVIMSDGGIRSIQLNEVSASDIAIGIEGNIYIYDSSGKLISLDNNGKLINDIVIDESRWDSRGPMRIINNEIFVRGSGRGDVLVAKIENGMLVSPSIVDLNKPLEEGFYGLNERRYVAGLIEGNEQDIDSGFSFKIIDKEGSATSRVVPLEGILSVEFVGEDGNGNTYLKTEENCDGQISVMVSTFDSGGNLIETIPVPGSDYDLWSIKTIFAGEDGSIYHMMPGRDKLTLNIFAPN